MAKIMFKTDGELVQGGRESAIAPRLAPAAATLPQMATLRVLTGPVAGKQLLVTKILTTIGKPNEQVALVTRSSRGYFLSHLEGAGCPIVNGRSISEGDRHLLRHGDVIEVAASRIEFLLN